MQLCSEKKKKKKRDEYSSINGQDARSVLECGPGRTQTLLNSRRRASRRALTGWGVQRAHKTTTYAGTHAHTHTSTRINAAGGPIKGCATLPQQPCGNRNGKHDSGVHRHQNNESAPSRETDAAMYDQLMMTSADFCVAISSAVASGRSHPAGVLWEKCSRA